MDISKNVKIEQAITMVVERSRLALQLAASAGRETTIILKHKDGQTTFAVAIDGER